MLVKQEADYDNLISSISEVRFPTPEEYEDIMDRLLGLRAFPSCVDEAEIFDLIYWTHVYYGRFYSRIFYEVFCLLKNKGSSDKRIFELLERAYNALDNRARLQRIRKRGNVRRRRLSRHCKMDIAIRRLAKEGLSPGKIARQIGFQKSTVIKILKT